MVNFIQKIFRRRKFVKQAWYPTKSWDWCMLEDEKKGIEPIFTDKNQYKVGRS